MNRLSLLGRHEVIVAVVLILVILGVGAVNPAFFSLFNMFSILKNSTVIGLFAIGFFLVLVVGGLDVSFAAVGVFAMYAAIKLAIAFFPEAPFVVLCGVAVLIGGVLGLINGLLVTQLQAPSLIVTLGTLSLYRGFLLSFVGTDSIRKVPQSVTDFARTNVVSLTAGNGAQVGLHVSVVIFLGAALLVFVVLRMTTFGRSLYAVGGNRVAAFRIGIPVRTVETVAYASAGALAGLAGLLSGAVLRLANPQTLVGSELDVIAAAVLGGAAITGGRGSVVGVCLGVLLVVITNNSLILLGIPSQWQKVAVGVMLLAAIGLPLLGTRRSPARTAAPATGPRQAVAAGG